MHVLCHLFRLYIKFCPEENDDIIIFFTCIPFVLKEMFDKLHRVSLHKGNIRICMPLTLGKLDKSRQILLNLVKLLFVSIFVLCSNIRRLYKVLKCLNLPFK